MKKVISLLVILVMLMSMCITVTAYDESSPILGKATFLKDMQVDDIFSEGLARVSKRYNHRRSADGYSYYDYKYGYMDKSGNLVIDYIFDTASHFRDGRAWVGIYDGKQGFIDKEGNFTYVFERKYYGKKEAPEKYYMDKGGKYYYTDYKDGVYTFGKAGIGVGGIDVDGNTVIPFQFDTIREFFEGKAIAEIDGKKVAIDTSGNILFELPFDSFKEQGAIAMGGYEYQPGFKSGILIGYDKDGKMGAINAKGEMVIDFGKYNELGDCQEGFIPVGNYIPGKSKSMEDTLFGYVNSQGQEIVPPKYQFTYPFNEGLGKFATGTYPNWSYGFVDTKGKVVIHPIKCMEMGNFSSGLACYSIWKDGNHYGYINKKGEKVIPSTTRYWLGDTLDNGLAAVQLYDHYGMEYQQYFIDSWGKVVFKTHNYLPNAGYIGDNVFQTGDGLLILNEEAKPSSSKIMVNGKEVVFEAYTINGSNYFKLRDLAYAINNTNKNFSVTWDQAEGAIKLTSSKLYTAVGGELTKSDGNTKLVPYSNGKIYKDGARKYLTAYTINESNFYKLRDIAKILDIGITWNDNTKTVGIDTAVGYVEP